MKIACRDRSIYPAIWGALILLLLLTMGIVSSAFAGTRETTIPDLKIMHTADMKEKYSQKGHSFAVRRQDNPLDHRENNQVNNQLFQGGFNNESNSFYLGNNQGNSGNQGYNRGFNQDNSGNSGNQVVNHQKVIEYQVNNQLFEGQNQNNSFYLGSNQGNSGEGGINEGFSQDNSGNQGNQVNNQGNIIGTQINGQGSDINNEGNIIEHQINYGYFSLLPGLDLSIDLTAKPRLSLKVKGD